MATIVHRNTRANWEGEKTPFYPAVRTGLTGVYLPGRSAAWTGRNRINPALPAVVQGTPTYHDGYVDFLGLDSNQSRLQTQHLESTSFTWILAYKTPASLVAGDLPCVLSASGGKSQAVPSRSVNGSRLIINSTDGQVVLSVAGWDPAGNGGAGASANQSVSLTATTEAPLPGSWAIISAHGSPTRVRLTNHTNPLAAPKQAAFSVQRDPGNMPITVGDNTINNNTYDGPISIAGFFDYEVDLELADEALAVAQLRARLAAWGIIA